MIFKKHLSIVCAIVLLFTSVVYTVADDETAKPAKASYTPGNVDETQDITAADALLVLQCAVGKIDLSDMLLSCADVDFSDDVTASDALQVLQYAVKKVSAFRPSGLKGKNINIATQYINKYFGDSASAKLYQSKIAEIEQKYGVNINMVSATYDDITSSINTGSTNFDIVEMNIVEGRSYARRFNFCDFNTSVVYDAESFESGITGSLTLGEATYGVATKAMSASPHGFLINADLLERYAPTSYSKLSQQFTDKEWTWQALTDLLQEYSANAPKGSDFILSNTNIIGEVIVSNAGYEVDFLPDKTGAVSSICSAEGIEAMCYLRGIMDAGYWSYSADVNAMYERFIAGEVPIFAYFLDCVSWNAGKYNFELTCLPFPIGPKRDDYVMCNFNGVGYFIPRSKKDTFNAEALVLNELATLNAQLEEQFVSDAAAAGLDELGQAVFRWSAQNTSRDFSSGPFTGAVGGPVDGSVINPGMDPAVVLPGIAELVQSEVDAYYGVFYKK